MKEKFMFFWSNKSPFSNWYKAEFEVDSIKFYCSEQYMMYHKALLFGDREIADQILKTRNPGKQKALGRMVKNFNQELWSAHRERIVYEGNKAKFLQNENLLKRLLKTKPYTLVEASPVDTIWGIGLVESDPRAHIRAKWRGKNLLSKILTILREDIIMEQSK